MFIKNSTDNRKSKPRANFGMNGIFDAIKAVEDALLILCTDSIASVGDLDTKSWQWGGKGASGAITLRTDWGFDPARIRPNVCTHAQDATRATELECIAHQIVENL